jgi:PAS domain S-box-containing protein
MKWNKRSIVVVGGRFMSGNKVEYSKSSMYQSFFENSPLGFAYFKVLRQDFPQSLDFECVEVNSAFESLTGLPRCAIVGKCLSDLSKETKNQTFEWREVFENVVSKGLEREVEQFMPKAKMLCQVHVHALTHEFIGIQIRGISCVKESSGCFAVIPRENTERQHVEKKLREQERFLFKVLETTWDGFLVVDHSGYFLMVNESYCTMTGYSKNELLAMSLSEIEADETPYEIANRMKRVINNKSELFETHHRRKDGSLLEIEVSVSWLDYGGGRFICFCRDITERKLAESRLVETKKRFEQISEAAEEVFYLVTPDNSEVLYINHAYEKVFGKSCQSLYEQPTSFLDALYEPDKKRVLSEFEKSMSTGYFDQEYRILRPDGSLSWIRSRSFPIRDENGVVYRHAGTAVDITDYKTIEAKLGKSLKDLLESQRIAHIGTWRLDVESGDVVWSEELYKMYGFDSALPVPHFSDHRHLFTSESWERLSQAIEKIQTSGIPYELELNTVVNDGSNGWMWARGEVEKDSEGLVIAIWGVAQDISERKRIEFDLIKAKEAAESSNIAKGQFLSNMSHEIRTPMNGFMGMLHLLQSTSLTEEQREIIDIAKASSESLLKLVNDILDYSKIEENQMTLYPKPFKLHTLIYEIIHLFKIQANMSGLTLDVLISSEVPYDVVGDVFRLKQVLSNLIGNAIKFTKVGGVTLEVRRLEVDSGHGFMLEFSIIDTGIGISHQDKLRLFNRFQQLDGSTTREFGGSGLGLSICKGIVEKMGGEISLESILGQGSRFYFTCWMGAPAEELKETQVPIVEACDIGNNMKILLVEDDPVNRVVLEKISKKRGWSIVSAENGQQAVDFYKQQAFDLVLMDVQMPVMNGYIATHKIRSYEYSQGKRTPIIAMTAFAIDNDVEKCFEAGMDDYVTKPVDFEAFYVMIKRWVCE